MKVIMREIEMLAYFDQKGYPKPIRLRIGNEDSEEKTIIQIECIAGIQEDRRAGNLMVRYQCQGILHGRMRPFEIYYETTKYKWFLYKI
ncbi:MAG: hypothetical protein Q4G61_07850 [Tissierellia bacterium]|nr:hypothetical protein [Tissierellia bacterium]